MITLAADLPSPVVAGVLGLGLHPSTPPPLHREQVHDLRPPGLGGLPAIA
jgi:hypothetical protein